MITTILYVCIIYIIITAYNILYPKFPFCAPMLGCINGNSSDLSQALQQNISGPNLQDGTPQSKVGLCPPSTLVKSTINR